MKRSRIVVAGTALALAAGVVPGTYLVNSAIQQADAQGRCWGIMTYDNPNRGGAQDVAFLTTFVPTEVEGVPTLIDKEGRTFIMGGNTYYVRHRSDLDFLVAGEALNVGYTLEGGRRYALFIEVMDPDKNDRLQLQQGGGLVLTDTDPDNDGDYLVD